MTYCFEPLRCCYRIYKGSGGFDIKSPKCFSNQRKRSLHNPLRTLWKANAFFYGLQTAKEGRDAREKAHCMFCDHRIVGLVNAL